MHLCSLSKLHYCLHIRDHINVVGDFNQHVAGWWISNISFTSSCGSSWNTQLFNIVSLVAKDEHVFQWSIQGRCRSRTSSNIMNYNVVANISSSAKDIHTAVYPRNAILCRGKRIFHRCNCSSELQLRVISVFLRFSSTHNMRTTFHLNSNLFDL